MTGSLERTKVRHLPILLLVALVACAGGKSADPSVPRAPMPASSTTSFPSTTTSTTSASTTATTMPPTSPVPTTVAPTTAAPTSTSTTAPSGRPLAGKVVVIDPGHNLRNGQHGSEIDRPVDAGGFTKPCNTTGTAGGDGYPEATFTWEQAQAVRSALEQAGATVVLTRADNDGWGPCVDQRGQAAALARADVLVSLHADGAAAGGHGFHVIHPTSIPGFTDATAGRSAFLATVLRDQLVAAGRTPSTYLGRDGLVARGDLGTLNRSPAPAAMIELGNMRNDEDLRGLEDPGWREQTARAIARAVTAFLAPGSA